MKKIELFASNGNDVMFDGIAKEVLSLEDVCMDAEHLLEVGKATYVRVSVDGETYMELKS